MPTILDYQTLLPRLGANGLACVYPGSGAFDLVDPSDAQVRGWIAHLDPSIRPAAMAHVRLVPEPAVPALVGRAIGVCRRAGTPIWLTPKSHWAYELEFGSPAWLPGVLREIGIDPELLRSRHGGDAIVFEPHETGALKSILTALLSNLVGSDFLLTLPEHKTVCTVHNHRQLWWRTADYAVWNAIGQMDEAG